MGLAVVSERCGPTAHDNILQTTQLCTVYPNDDVSTSIWQGIQKTKDASGLTLLPLLRMLGVSEMSMSM